MKLLSLNEAFNSFKLDLNEKEFEKLCFDNGLVIEINNNKFVEDNFATKLLNSLSFNSKELTNEKESELNLMSYKLRLKGLDMVYNAKSGHIGGAFSIAELLSTLYFLKMNVDPKDPKNNNRDRLVLSKGHCTPTYYSALAYRGFFPEDELNYFRKINHILQGHPDCKHIPGVDMTTGSLGLGFSAAVGMALGLKKQDIDANVYAILGDGEVQEGQIYEALMFAGNYHLDNLIAFLDYNHLQISGTVEEVMNIAPIDKKFEDFGFNVISIDGHSIREIDKAINLAKKSNNKPTAIILNTIKGKGVSFMENNFNWHGTAPSKEQYDAAHEELLKKYNEIKEAK